MSAWHVSSAILPVSSWVCPQPVLAATVTRPSMPECLAWIVRHAIQRTIGMLLTRVHTLVLPMKADAASITAAPPVGIVIPKHCAPQPARPAITVITLTTTAVGMAMISI
jgi:hypothetical protein